jgi:hypothetical protein
MKVLFVAALVLIATGLPAFAQSGRSPGYGGGYEDAPRGYGRGYDDERRGYGRGSDDERRGYGRGSEGAPRGYGRGYDDEPRGYGRGYRGDEDRSPRYGRRGEDVGPTGLQCVINPQYRHILRSCAAAATFRPGGYCVCKLPNSPQAVPGTIQ